MRAYLKNRLELIGHKLAPLYGLWRDRHKKMEKRLPHDLKSFLPPSLEVLEKPPHPIPRVLLVIVGLICLFALIWACVGKIDVITVAEGKIIPSGKIKEIQPYDRGVVSRILVSEGQFVKAGEALIELDKTQTSADEIRLAAELDYSKRKLARRKILAELLRRPPTETVTFDQIDKRAELFGEESESQLLHEEYKSIVAQSDTLRAQLKEREADLLTSQEIIKQYQATLPLVEKRLGIVEDLYKRKLMTVTEYLALEEERLRQHHALEAEKSRSAQLRAAFSATEQQIIAQYSQSLSEVLSELDDLKRQVEAVNQELSKVRDLGAKQILAAPVDGTVKGLMANTVGGVVSPAQVLMEIVPYGEVLEVEAFVSNQDIGYVQAGQSAEVKINTFPFTKYGVIDAMVAHVAEDATVDEKQGLIYRARLVLKKNTILVDGKEVPLLPGMAVSAEIATDQRRLIEFFLAPLLKMRQESLRER